MLQVPVRLSLPNPGHAPLDHDRALRALFAGDDAGRRRATNAAGLLHFGQNRLDRQPHQRGRDLRLLPR